MPVTGSNFNLIRVTNNSQDIGPGKMQNMLKTEQTEGNMNNFAVGDSTDNKNMNEKINMEAYQAYYNTNETN